MIQQQYLKSNRVKKYLFAVAICAVIVYDYDKRIKEEKILIEIRYFDKNGNGDEQGKYYVYQQARSMEEAESIAKEMNKKGFTSVTIVNDGKDSWEIYKKWLKRSLDLAKMVQGDSTATVEEKATLNEKIKTFELCLKKMEDMEKNW